MYQAVELPLCIDLLRPAQREPIQALVVAQVLVDTGSAMPKRRVIISLHRALSNRSFMISVARPGLPDGVHLWCEQHRLVVVFPFGSWAREVGAG